MVNKRNRIEPMPDRLYGDSLSFKEFSAKIGSFVLGSMGNVKEAIENKISQFGAATVVFEPGSEANNTDSEKQV